MELADSYETIAEVPAEHTALYVEEDGKAVLKVTGLKTQSDFDTFSTALKARLADATDKLKNAKSGGLSREDMTALIKETATALRGANGEDRPKGGDTDPALEARVHDLERELASTKEKLTTSETTAATATKTADASKITNALVGAATKAGVRPNAIDGLVELLSHNFELSSDGKVVTKLEGQSVQGVTPNTAPEPFMTAIKAATDFSHFWPDSKGGGADGGGGGGGGDADNPWSADGWNMTKQGQLVRTNRPEAERLAKSVGSHIGATAPKKK